MQRLYASNATNGLFAMVYSEEGAPADSTLLCYKLLNDTPSNPLVIVAHYSVGARADSAYEYMLKQWLQSGDAKARDQCTFTLPLPSSSYLLLTYPG